MACPNCAELGSACRACKSTRSGDDKTPGQVWQSPRGEVPGCRADHCGNVAEGPDGYCWRHLAQSIVTGQHAATQTRTDCVSCGATDGMHDAECGRTEAPVQSDAECGRPLAVAFDPQLHSARTPDEKGHRSPSGMAQSPYYDAGGPELTPTVRAWGLSWPLANVVKYVRRAGRKVPPGEMPEVAALRDLHKAREYLDFEIRHLESQITNTSAGGASAE